MDLMKKTPTLLQSAAILLTSVAASYAFQHTQTAFEISGLCFYRYVVYGLAAPLGYICFSRVSRTIALAFSLSLLVVALSPVGQEALGLFPSFVPFLAMSMGAATILVGPKSRGRGFLEFVIVLILPAVLAESRIGGSFRLISTIESIGYHELVAVVACVFGGCLYLRYATLTNLNSYNFLSKGGDEKDVVKISTWSNLFTILIVTGACGTAAILMVAAPIVADALRTAFSTLPIYFLVLALGAGIVITMILRILRQSQRRSIEG